MVYPCSFTNAITNSSNFSELLKFVHITNGATFASFALFSSISSVYFSFFYRTSLKFTSLPCSNVRAALCCLLAILFLFDLGDFFIGNGNLWMSLSSILAFTASQFLYVRIGSIPNIKLIIKITSVFWFICFLARASLVVLILKKQGISLLFVNALVGTSVATVCLLLSILDVFTWYFEVKRPRDEKETEEYVTYNHNSANWWSKLTFFWLNRLLIKGASRPLELEDLGRLPEEERIHIQFKRFLQVFSSTKSADSSNRISLWYCFFKLYSRSFVLGGILKLLGDAVGLLGPLGISVILKYIEKLQRPSQNLNTPSYQQEVSCLTISEFFNNGFMMTTIVFISALAQGSFSQASTHLLNTEGIRLKSALQALIYCKTLRCRKIVESDTECNKIPGNVTNLISEDCYNVMSCFWIGHYVWAVPVKIFVLIVLLYYEIGISAIFGALSCIIIVIPLQFYIGKSMSYNLKFIMDASDERMKQINEALQGMKLLKLRGWEDMFFEKILLTRNKELKFLNRDSIYWALMTFLTHASSVFIALVTFGIYSLIETEPLSPSNIFAGLALFNQLTVPLFVFPITVPIILTALTSTKRIEEFLSSSEVSPFHKKRREGMNGIFDSLDYMNFRQTKVIINGRSSEILANILEINEDCDSEEDLKNYSKTENVSQDDTLSDVSTELNEGCFKNSLSQESNFSQTLEDSEKDDDQDDLEIMGESDYSIKAVYENQHAITRRLIIGDHRILKSNNDSGNTHKEKPLIQIHDAVCLWNDSTKSSLFLKDVSIPLGELTVVSGKVGSGKTSFLAALLGEMECISGLIHWDMKMTVAYVSQKPWLLNATLRDNILFGRRYRAKRFHQVIVSCALRSDVDLLPAKDLTLIGENGIQLSGGQQQRIAIARALYSRAAVIILDDPLSALDYITAKFVFERAIKRLSSHHKRTVILATHSTNLLPDSYQLVVMESNRVVKCERKTASNRLISQLFQKKESKRTATERWHLLKCISKLSFHHARQMNNRDVCWRTSSTSSRNFVPFRKRLGTFTGSRYFVHDLLLPTDECNEDDKDDGLEFKKWWESIMDNNRHKSVLRSTSLQADQFNQFSLILRQSSSSNMQPTSLRPRLNTCAFPFRHDSLRRNILKKQVVSNLSKEFSTLTVTDMKDRLSLKRVTSAASDWSEDFAEDDDIFSGDSILWGENLNLEERKYGKISCKIYWSYLNACGLIVSVCYILITILWQSLRVYTDFWLSFFSESNSQQAWSYLSSYAVHSLGCIILSLASVGFGQFCGAAARKKLHNKLLFNLLHCSVHYFETTPLGRIIGRFSNDIVVLDKKIATSIQRLFQFLLLCFSAIAVNCIVSPWFLLMAIPICTAYYYIQNFYRKSSRELQRLECITRAPILSHLVETERGADTIRAYGQEDYFITSFFHKLDIYTNAFIIHNSVNRWLGIVLDYLGAIIVFIAMMMSLISALLFPTVVSPSFVGLAINYTLLVPIYLNWVVKFLADMEIHMAAVEKILQVASEPPENYRSDARILKSWPSKGDIKFENVSILYPENELPAIKSFNLHVTAGQKVGVCGRSGSGKTSLVMSLFQMVTVSDGRILIDDVDISKIPLKKLRSNLSVIPQDVIMFSGSIRDNLDLLNEYSDAQLWKALEMAQLLDVVDELPHKLYEPVKEGGSNFSIGQRQLFCLARAILQNSVCLIMDEATSSLDPAIESKLLICAERAFEGKTVLSVTHHLSSILSYDRIIVLDGGIVVEEGSPSQLLSRPLGFFSSMFRTHGENSTYKSNDLKSLITDNSLPER